MKLSVLTLDKSTYFHFKDLSDDSIIIINFKQFKQNEVRNTYHFHPNLILCTELSMREVVLPYLNVC